MLARILWQALVITAFFCPKAISIEHGDEKALAKTLADLKTLSQDILREICTEDLPVGFNRANKMFRKIEKQHKKFKTLLAHLKAVALHPVSNNCPAGMAWGAAANQGMRIDMQDDLVIYGTDQAQLFAVFDGHGAHGHWVAQFCAAHLIESCFSKPSGALDLDAFHHYSSWIENEILAANKDWYENSGTTLCALARIEDELHIVNVGDSRLILKHLCGHGFDATADHRPDNLEERKRIEDLGGWVDNQGYVCGILGMTRCIGDGCQKLISPEGKKIISSHAYVAKAACSQYDFGILACDGLWDVMPPWAAIDMVISLRRDLCRQAKIAPDQATPAMAGHIAHALIYKAIFIFNSPDNVTVIVVFFNHARPEVPRPGAPAEPVASNRDKNPLQRMEALIEDYFAESKEGR